MRCQIARAAIFFAVTALLAGEPASQTKPVEGLRDNTPTIHALVNARIVQAPGRVIEHGTIVVRDGTIEAVGANVKAPDGARVWDYDGLTVYAGLIDLYTHVGVTPAKDGAGSGENGEAHRGGYWNPNVTPQRNVLDSFDPTKKDLEAMRSLGFTCVLIVPDTGIIRGSSALVHMGDGDANDREIRSRVTQCVDVVDERRRGRTVVYPTSLMGRIALIRQALLDAQWYAAAQTAYAKNPAQERPEANEAMAALAEDLEARRPVLCAAHNDLNVDHARRIAREFDLNLWVKGAGFEYRMADAFKQAGTRVIVPLQFPDKPDVDSPEAALDVTLATLQHWEAAPANARVLDDAGVEFAFTTHGLKKAEVFHRQVATAIERGLDRDTALAAVTTVPAAMLGMEKTLGSIDRGKAAHLVVADGDLFTEDVKVVDVWIDGRSYEINPRPEVDPRGTWALEVRSGDLEGIYELKITGEIDKLKGTVTKDSTDVSLKRIALDLRRLTITLPGEDLGVEGMVRIAGAVEGKSMAGQGELPNGDWFGWGATLAVADEPDAGEDGSASAESADAYPPGATIGAFGLSAPPEQPKHVFVRNATIWTSGPRGNLDGADMLITRGRIAKIGHGLEPPAGAHIIDAEGKHVTPGLIDCHSHTGTNGSVNEAGQAVSAEVRIADVLNPRDIALYRELAGGLTIANVLHGSANPIGGQNAVIKLRWCDSPDAMLIDDAKPGIKFALGENVKQSNWGDNYTTRYPQTRMGVEQIIRDRFDAALAYEAEWKQYESNKKKVPPRRDLELDALLEVLRGGRLVHCHSYRQDEILMLVRLAEDYGFTIGTFQHVLEGYKVAEVMAAHGAGASTFSDWWAYKFEVYDAIPYNGALMHDVGVLVSFNSDSDELARRMNLEAAKAVGYGGVAEQEALKFVTLNPAKQLRIDHRVGSLEEGKDGDFVVWSGGPLSTYSICQQTWIEGRKYFDVEDDRRMREEITVERARLVQKVLAAGDEAKKNDEPKRADAGEGGR